MEKFKRLFGTLLIFALYSCVSIKPPTFLQSDYENKPVESIGIFELIRSNELKISETDLKKVENIIIEKVRDRDYDVNGTIKNEDFDGDITKICQIRNIDAVLFSSISKYSDDFLGDHALAVDFKLFNANGDSIWVDKIDVYSNGLLGFVGLLAGVVIGTAVQPTSVPVSTSTKVQIGLGVGVLAGLLVEGMTPYIEGPITERFRTLPQGSGQGKTGQ